MGKQEAKATYKHFVPPAKKVENWHKNFNFVLIESMDDLRDAFSPYEDGKYFMSFDTETTGLDAEELELVGYSFCLDGRTAYYVPVYHFEYPNNLGEDAVEFIYNRMVNAKKVFMFNMKFDARVIEYRGYKEQEDKLKNQRWMFVKYDMSKVPYFDVAIPVWLGDTNIKLPSLKWAATHYLGFDMMHFDEVIESAGNFFYLNPSENPDTVFYAASDALCTYLLVTATMKYFAESGLAGKIDNKMLYPLMHYETEKLWLDKDLIDRTMVSITEEVDRYERGVYEALGYQINLNSPAQVSQAFERLGIDTGERTSTGFMKTGMKDLEALPDSIKEQYPALDMFVNYKSLFKLKSSYISVLQKEAERKGFLRGAYKTQQVPTGRLAAGKDAKNTYFSPINLQALPKPHVAMYDVFDLRDRTLFSKKDNIIMGYKFVISKYEKDENGKKVHVIPDEPSYIGWAEGMDPKNNIRACITPKMYEDSGDDEFVYCAIDYAAQELRIPANLSKEPVWVNAFVSGGDVHKSTAISIWGEEKYNKDYRKMAKAANFCESEDNMVLTSNRGYIRAKDVVESDILCAKDRETSIVGIERLDDQDCIEIVLDSGIKASYHRMHKLLCWKGSSLEWVRVKDITDEQIVTFRDKKCKTESSEHIVDLKEYTDNRRNLTKYGISFDRNSKEFAYLMGLYIGDGNLDVSNGKYFKGIPSCGLRQCVSNEIADKVCEYARSIGFESEGSVTCSRLSDAVSIISYGGSGMGRYIYENFGGPNNKKVPDFVFSEWSKTELEYFLAGLIDSDGSSLGNRWVFYNTNEDIVHSVALICNYLGMRTSYSVNESAIYREGKRITEGVNGKFKDCHSLVVYNRDEVNIPILLESRKCDDYPKAWNYRWEIAESYRNVYKDIRESCERGNSIIENAVSNIRDRHTGFTEFNLREIEKYADIIPLKSSWYPAKIMSKREHKGTIIAIECDTHEYIAMSMNSHNSILYGAAAQSFADNPMFNMNLSEAEEFYNTYKKALPTLFQWEERLQRRGRREGYVNTYFGRPRRVKGYFDNRNFAFANRTIVNTTVQGTASDILKIVLCKLWTRVLNNPSYRDDCAWRCTIHDEIGYTIRASRIFDILPVIEDIMTFKLPEWQVEILTESSLGWNMGSLFAFQKIENEDGTFYYRPKLD